MHNNILRKNSMDVPIHAFTYHFNDHPFVHDVNVVVDVQLLKHDHVNWL